MELSRINNFDLIRILAALQVVYSHAKGHLKIQNEYVHFFYDNFLKFLPGVPIFFFVSGFLVFWSYERNIDSSKRFYINRALRIFPALWFCTLITLILFFFSFPYSRFEVFFTGDFFIWILGQLTFLQFYTPDSLRFWGVGTPNGSLWTITIEIQFYLIIPLLFYLFKRKTKEIYIILIALISIFANLYIGQLNDNTIIGKLGKVLILPYLYYFLFGILAYMFWGRISKFFVDKLPYWILIYSVFIILAEYFFEIRTTQYFINSYFSIVSSFLLSCTVLSFAYSFRKLSKRIISGNDISYGVYIYHMLVINYFIELNLIGSFFYFLMTFVLTSLLGYISWIFVERKMLKWKKYFLNFNSK